MKIGNHKNAKYYIDDWTLPNSWDTFSSKIIKSLERFDCLIIDEGSESWLPCKTTSKCPEGLKLNDEDYEKYYINMFKNLKTLMNNNFYWIFDYRDYDKFVNFLFDLEIYPLFFLRLNNKNDSVHCQDSQFLVIFTDKENLNIPPFIQEKYIYKYEGLERTYLNNPTLFVPYEQKNINPVFRKCIVDAYPDIHDNRELVKIILSSNWKCKIYTFENTGGVYCEICGGKKDGTKSKKRSRSKRSIKKRSRSKRSVRKRRSKRSVKKRRSNKIKKL